VEDRAWIGGPCWHVDVVCFRGKAAEGDTRGSAPSPVISGQVSVCLLGITVHVHLPLAMTTPCSQCVWLCVYGFVCLLIGSASDAL
jgi:hypothetical protein